MLKYFITRLAAVIPKLLVISLLIFLGLEVLPGDPVIRSISPETYEQMTPAQVETLREALGINDNMAVRYIKWFGRILRGDFGYSISSRSNIGFMLAARLPATLELAAGGLIIATVFGLILGFISAVKQNTPIDYALTAFSMAGVSIPEFFLGMGAILIFAIKLKWFPTGGRLTYGKEALFDRLEFLVLPAVCLGIVLIATLMRFTRNSMLDVLGKDYVKTARSKGLSEIEVNISHGFRNAIIPILVILIFRLPMLVSGTVVIETVFNYPGMGSLMISAVTGADMPVVMIGTMIISGAILISSFLLDILIATLDPRIRYEKRG